MTYLTDRPIWQQLEQHCQGLRSIAMRDLFAQDHNRFDQFSLEAPGLFLDYSKNRITSETLSLLTCLAKDCDLASKREKLLTGQVVNQSEQCAAWHTALRSQNHPEVQAVLARMQEWVNALHRGEYRGFSGQPITDVVSVGVGGSDLGPAMLHKALSDYRQDKVRCHFISHYDQQHVSEVLSGLNPQTSLFFIVSKSFGTQETLGNFELIKQWFIEQGIDHHQTASHFIAITANAEKATTLGFNQSTILPFWDWVGGRFSLWSAVGFINAVAMGMDNFYALLQGAKAMDLHFQQADFESNMPVLLGLLGIWYGNFFKTQTQAIIPYSEKLNLLPHYLQQLHMESLGKNITQDDVAIDYATGMIIWGEVGFASQHSFNQFFMQGKQQVPVDFILPLQKSREQEASIQFQMANCFAQSQTLMQGYLSQDTQAFLEPCKIIPGNSPSNTILMDDLSPYALGSLLALYEHKVFVQSVIWNINAFDQWGVEQGKKIAGKILMDLQQQKVTANYDASTQGLMARITASTEKLNDFEETFE